MQVFARQGSASGFLALQSDCTAASCLLVSGNLRGSRMEDDREKLPGGRVLANDNQSRPVEEEGGDALEPAKRLERVVFDIARLIGRQLAREEFERIRASNDNQRGDPARKS